MTFQTSAPTQYCLAPKPVLSKVEGFIWGSIKKQTLAQTGFSLLVERSRKVHLAPHPIPKIDGKNLYLNPDFPDEVVKRK